MHPPKAVDLLTLSGVRENNLKNLSLSLNHDSFIVVTGLSGSGKSTLAIDTIYAEGGRRYIETFSPYTRQFLDRLHRPDIDTITGVRPALALEQRNRMTSSRSTVGTTTEINDYIKIAWAHLAEIHCPTCETTVSKDTPLHTQRQLLELAHTASADQLLITFRLESSGLATQAALQATLEADGFLRFFSPLTNTVHRMDELSGRDAAADRGNLLIVVDRFKMSALKHPTKGSKDQLLASINQAFTYGKGSLTAVSLTPTVDDSPAEASLHLFHEQLTCNGCGATFRPARPFMFSFNSPLGACPTCHGFGRVLAIDPDLVVPNPSKSIADGAVACWATDSTKHEFKKLKELCKERGISTTAAWRDLPERDRRFVLEGSKEKALKYRGVNGWFDRLQQKRHKMHVRMFVARFRGEFDCQSCNRTRLRPEALNYRVQGRTLPELWNLPLDESVEFFRTLATNHRGQEVADVALDEVVSRLDYLVQIGLGYLSLDRQSRTLSGGESQRVNLTSILGARLVNTLLVLDEPTIGLHATDTERLITTLNTLRDRGNTLLVVEHDPEVMRAADQLLDIGPRAGSYGGEIIFQGPPEAILDCKPSLTGQYLSGVREWPMEEPTNAPPKKARASSKVPASTGAITIRGASANNLRGIDVTIPLGKLVVLTGVSGSGKSSLISSCLHGPYERLKQGVAPESLFRGPLAKLAGLEGLDGIDEITLIDQSPIGKTPRSNPATYTKAWDLIRDCLADSPEAQALGLSRSAFSFNVDGGRCPVCSGAGHLRIEMQFLADVFVECEACGGNRFQDKVLTVTFAGKNVVDLLHTSLDDTVKLFQSLGDEDRVLKIQALLQPLLDLGLGYLTLGHPLSEVSGGEAQRVKLASYLHERTKARHLFILDEPTTGLHPYNVEQLMRAFKALLAKGHSVLCVEHNLDVIAQADWLIDLGPGGGVSGGNLVVEGTQEELRSSKKLHARSHTARLLAEYLDELNEKKTPVAKRAKRPINIGERRASKPREAATKEISILGARHHNLRDVSVKIPHQSLTVVTGVSGSGKSTLAFDILFAEGQRRYIDCLSPYARQYIKQFTRADVDLVSGIPPTIAVSQKTSPPLGVSTIATTTELYQYLRLLYSKVGVQHCTHDDTPISSFSSLAIANEIVRRHRNKRIFLFAPVVSGRKGFYNDLFERAYRAEITEARVDGRTISISPDLRLERHKLHWISLVVGSLSNPGKDPEMLLAAIDHALLLGGGTLEVAVGSKDAEPEIFSTARVCPTCSRGYRELDPQDFSFRSARGVCEECSGRGWIGEGEDRELCPTCDGARIGSIGRHVYLNGKRINELTAMTAPALHAFLKDTKFPDRLAPIIEPILHELRSRLTLISSVGLDYLALDRDASTISGGEAQRLRLARTLGSPLTGVCYVLDEPSIGLHPQDQEQLMSTLLALRDAGNTVVVVEHDEDTIRQADLIIDIGPRGGAGGGELVVAGTVAEVEACERSVTGQALRERKDGEPRKFDEGTVNLPTRWKAGDAIELIGASANNLQNVSCRFPLGALTVVVGVSGAGKSSLVHGSLIPAVMEAFEGGAKKKKKKHRPWAELRGVDHFDRLLEIDQTPAGKTATSCPASFLGIFDGLRKLYAQLPDAKARGWDASHFSFNTGKGRCTECGGRGVVKIPMSFLPDATTECEACNGLRYNEETLELRFQGLSIGDILQRTMSEAREVLANHRLIRRALDYVHELGLGYLTLGQPTHTLSGGETQRLKIARELGLREAERTLYVLDEPTIGLHMADVDKLLAVIRKLRDKGNTIVIVEHNLDIIQAADYLLEMGPGPGTAGGQLIFEGLPGELARSKKDTPTKRFLKGAQPAKRSIMNTR